MKREYKEGSKRRTAMIKQLLTGLWIFLAALFIPSASLANDVSIPQTVPTNTVSIPVVQPLPAVTSAVRIMRNEVCPPVPLPSDPWPAQMVSLVGGCQTTSKQQALYADIKGLPIANSRNFNQLVATGQLVKLEGSNIQMKSDKVIAYVLPSTKTVVLQLAHDFGQAGCGTLGISDALRLDDRSKPDNASPDSVHTRGMAVDVRVNGLSADCKSWLQTYLLDQETAQVVDATEEILKPHMHVVVPVENIPTSIHLATQSESPSDQSN
jgi:hypothetical protein